MIRVVGRSHCVVVGLLVFLLASPALAIKIDIYDGDVRTACEVVLCLSSGDRPKECKKPIKRYIKKTLIPHKPWKTYKKRLKFLKLCPLGNYEGKGDHLDALAEGGVSCEIDALVAKFNTDQPPYTLSLPTFCVSLANNTYTVGHELPTRAEVCHTAHLGDLGSRPRPIVDWAAYDGYSDEAPLLNAEEVNAYDQNSRLQKELYQQPICVSRWHDPARPAPEAALTGLLTQEVTRVDAQLIENRSALIY